ncbi:MAG: cytochrome c-type biogenesis protein CcmH [Acidimicrobiia bacterium]
MSERVRNLLSVTGIVVMAVILVALVVSSPTEADRVEQIGKQIKCPVCQSESIANSPSQMARDMMALVSERVAGGASDTEIIDELLAAFSGAVLLDPPASGVTLVLWVAPVVALAAGLSIIVWWRRHPGTDVSPDAVPPSRSRSRTLVGGLILAGAFAVVVIVAGFFLQDREGPAAGVANPEGQDLSEVSNETMEAVVEANLDDPQINGMRLALAERYYEVGDYSSAFPHYLAVAEAAAASNAEVVTALVRLGWMAWDGNGEVDTAIGLFDQALIIDSDSTTAMFLKGQVLWCGAGESNAAADLFSDVLADPELSEDSKALVGSSFEAVTRGEPCA